MSAEIATQPHNLPLAVSKETCSGGTYIVTGANTGLGFEAAKHLVAFGSAKVIMAVRNISVGEKAKVEIEEATDVSNVAEVWELDLSKYDSVKAFAKKASELDRIDALIENAGVAMSERILAEGHLMNVTVNIISTFLLAVLLLPKLSESAKKFNILPHLSIIGSGAGFDVEEDWKAIKDDPLVKMEDENLMTLKTYPLSKLVQFVAVRHLATLIPVSRTGVVLNLVCPGFCKTSLSRNAPPAFRENIGEQHKKYGRTAEDGSRTLLHGAVAGEKSHGKYLSSCAIAEERVPQWSKNDDGTAAQKQVWDVIASELESIEPGCVKKILV